MENRLCNAGDTIATIMKDFYESSLKDQYTGWVEARSYLHLEAISRKKPDQLLNIEAKYDSIHSDYWVNYALDYKKIKADFEMKPAQAFLKRITCNLYCF